MQSSTIHIIAGDHDPIDHHERPGRFGLHVDLSKVVGELWDPTTVAEITWGQQTPDGRRHGTVRLKNGDGVAFWNYELIQPYVRAWTMAKADHDLKQALVEHQAKDTGSNVMLRDPGWFPTRKSMFDAAVPDDFMDD